MDQAAVALARGVDARHPDGQYSRGAKWFHWLTVLPILVMLLSGLTIRFINYWRQIKHFEECLGFFDSRLFPRSRFIAFLLKKSQNAGGPQL